MKTGNPPSLFMSLCFVLSVLVVAPGFAREIQPLDAGWLFTRGDPQQAHQGDFPDQAWTQVDLPHDWSIAGPFSQDAPAAGNGGYLPTGIGWYRKHFHLSDASLVRRVWIEFDGIYENSEVWINGQSLGKRPFGYISFHYDLTPHLRAGANVLAVRVDNSHQPNTRWYSGSGIYRHVRLVIAHPLHVAHWGTAITTPEVSPEAAAVRVRTTLQNEGDTPAQITLLSILRDADRQEVARAASNLTLAARQTREAEQTLTVAQPRRWSVESPALYALETQVLGEDTLLDTLITPFGIREIQYDAQRGFLLNGQPVKMKGVCLHHDGGPVGAAVPLRLWERRLEKLKAMGCNAIRTSHNPVAPEFLDLCDRMGFLVQNEVFDEWLSGKRAWTYHRYFQEWSQRDLTDFIHRDRNHPCVVMWSAGNEIGEQRSDTGHEILQPLLDTFHREDPTRPVTTGNDNIAADGGAARLEFLKRLDIVGYNYMDRWHERRELYNTQDKIDHPDWLFTGTESSSVRGVRGAYSLGPDLTKVSPNYHSGMIRAEQLWKYVATRDYIIGDFMWTGIDYLGESRWPHRNASSGVLDLCGFEKDGYYFYQSQWTDTPMIHLFPHWNWPGREGQFIPVLAYTNCDTVELYLNDRFVGAKSKEFPRQGTSGGWNRYERPKPRSTTADLHLSWDVPYEPGTLRAIGQRNGQVVLTQEIQTAGPAAAIQLQADRSTITTDPEDLAHIVIKIVDAQGRTVPTADHWLAFSITEPGQFMAAGNGNPADHDPFAVPRRRAFNGLALAMIKAAATGTIRFTAQSEGLPTATLTIQVQ